MIDKKKSIDAKRFATNSGRFYGPEDMDTYHMHENPLKPSWTNVASVESSPGLSTWYKDNGKWADIIGPTSAIIGTITHDAADLMNQGEEITEDWIIEQLETHVDIRWKLIYPMRWDAVELIKKQIMQYKMWYEEHQPQIIKSELMMWHPDVPYAGTADLVLNIYNKRQDQNILMMADLKTGNENEKHYVQCMAYAILLEKIYNVKVGALGVLYCQGRWRDEVKPGKMKVKVVRDKAGELTKDAQFLTNRVVKLYELWKSTQKVLQPKKKKFLPKSFKLIKNKKKEVK